MIAANGRICHAVLEAEEWSWFGGLLTAVDVDCIGIAAPVVIVIGALGDGLASICSSAVGAHVGSASRRLPSLVCAAVPAIEVAIGVVAQAVVKAFPSIRAASSAIRVGAWLFGVGRRLSIWIVACLSSGLCCKGSYGGSSQPREG